MLIRTLVLCLFVCPLMLTACQGPPPTQTVIIITEIVEVVITATPAPSAGLTVDSIRPTRIAAPAADAATIAISTVTPNDSPKPDAFPTVTKGAIYVAEQRFEKGWMLWLQPVGQIWILSVSDGSEYIWTTYNDTFVEGEAESDAEVVPPEGLFQPVRGFGKLWRENPEVKATLGWALDTELGHTTRYEYHPGGSLNQNSEYELGPGHHLVESLYGDTFRLNEDTSTWQIDG